LTSQGTSLRPSLASFQFSAINTTFSLGFPTIISAASADRSNLPQDRGHVSLKQTSLISLSINVIANATTGATTFSVTNELIPTAAIIIVPAGTVGHFFIFDVPSAFVPGQRIGILVTTVSGAGAMSAQCYCNLNA
jgi:hypothetical protein